MIRRHQKLALSGMLMLGLSAGFTSAYAAKPINLLKQDISVLQSFAVSPTAAALKNANTAGVIETRRSVGFNNMLHVRVQQTYSGYPVLGADAVVHIPHGAKTAKGFAAIASAAKSNKGFMNGTFFQDLHADLANAPAFIFDKAQSQKALQDAIKLYQSKVGVKADVLNPESKLMVYVDKKTQKAHWVYRISFVTAGAKKHMGPAIPVFVVDAITSEVYRTYDNLQSASGEAVSGGGYGGNEKQKYTYDGISADKLDVTRSGSKCYLQNENVIVNQCNFTLPLIYRCMWKSAEANTCKNTDPQHNNVYWNGDADKVNGAFSPANDALYNGKIVKNMYQDWYKAEVLTEDDGVTPMQLNMTVHIDMENAYWDPQSSTMNFGDGGDMFYPLTSLGVTAHEVSHGFTSQHSNLTYEQQSGGLNESYSDMAAQAAEVYAKRGNTWQIGPEIVKGDGALRYMDNPNKGCEGREGIPGEHCALSDADQYDAYIEKHKNDPAPSTPLQQDTRYPNVHYSSGVFNRFFYLLSTSEGWDVQKAFGLMMTANANYWTADSDYTTAACGVMQAADELGYDKSAIKAAFDVVKVQSAC